MGRPRFSVIIPALNEEQFLPNLLSSLTRQTVKNFDVVVVDGLSVDSTVAVAKRFEKKLPLTVVACDKPGVSRQRNMGARLGKADWLVFVDADSILLSNFFERIGVYIDRKHPKFFTTWLKTDSEDPGDAIAGFILNMGIEGGVLVERPWAPGPLTVITREAFEKIGGYDEETTFAEDHDLSMVALKKGISFHILREILYIYSLRRFRREGTLKVLERNMKSALTVALTKRGPKTMPGFVAGGLLYGKRGKKKKNNGLIPKEFERSVRRFIEDFVSL